MKETVNLYSEFATNCKYPCRLEFLRESTDVERTRPALPLVTVTADRFGILGGASHQALDLRGIGIASEITSCQSFSNARDSSGGIFLCGMRAPT